MFLTHILHHHTTREFSSTLWPLTKPLRSSRTQHCTQWSATTGFSVTLRATARGDKWKGGGVGEWNDLAMSVLLQFCDPLSLSPAPLREWLCKVWCMAQGAAEGGVAKIKEAHRPVKNGGSEAENTRLLLYTWHLSEKGTFALWVHLNGHGTSFVEDKCPS